MKYNLNHTTRYSYSDAVPVCHNIVHLRPRNLERQSYRDFQMIVYPEPFDIHESIDSFGNGETYFSIEQAHMGLTVTATCSVTVNDELAIDYVAANRDSWEPIQSQLAFPGSPELIESSLFRFESQRVKPFPAVKEYALGSFTTGRPILDACLDLTARIYKDFVYDPRATTVLTPIETVFESRRGVCQDFAHFQIACLRSLGLACRYVSGYMRTYPPPGSVHLQGCDASHAWISVYCGDAGWIDFDPTNNLIPNNNYITVAWGRDYSDVCPIRGVILGGGNHQMTVSVDVIPEE